VPPPERFVGSRQDLFTDAASAKANLLDDGIVDTLGSVGNPMVAKGAALSRGSASGAHLTHPAWIHAIGAQLQHASQGLDGDGSSGDVMSFSVRISSVFGASAAPITGASILEAEPLDSPGFQRP
jgi:hypothetical protein